MKNRLIQRFGLPHFVVYFSIGMVGLSVDYFVFWALLEVNIPHLLATAISSLLGLISNYFLNAKINFKTPRSLSGAAKYVGVGIAGTVSSVLFLYCLVQVGIAPLIAKTLSIPPIVLLQYWANSRWAFRPNVNQSGGNVTD